MKQKKKLRLVEYLFVIGVLLFSAAVLMAAILFVDVQNNFNSGSASSLAVTKSSTGGNFMVAWVRHGTNSTSTISVTDSNAATWTQAGSTCVVGTDQEAMFYIANSPAVTSVTANFATAAVTNTSIVVEEFSGIAASSPLDVASTCATNSSSVTTLTSSAITTTNANDLLVYGIHLGAGQSGAAWTAGSGYTLPSNNDATGNSSTNTRSALQYQIVTSIQTGITTSMTWTTAGNAAGILASFKMSAATPTGFPVIMSRSFVPQRELFRRGN